MSELRILTHELNLILLDKKIVAAYNIKNTKFTGLLSHAVGEVTRGMLAVC
jgi:hypothetical protein